MAKFEVKRVAVVLRDKKAELFPEIQCWHLTNYRENQCEAISECCLVTVKTISRSG